LVDLATTHERLSVADDIRGPRDRAFGLTFAVVFVLIGVVPLLRGRPVRWWSLATAAVFLGVALLAPRLLAPLNRVWFNLGLLLHRVTNPILMGVVFVTTVTPLAFVLRALGKDPLRLRLDPSASTYWIERRPPGPAPKTMSRLF
jgi:hypothetical protein